MLSPELLASVQEAARAAGELIRPALGRARQVVCKGPANLVTEVDQASEALLRELLGRALPEAAFLGEEGGGRVGQGWTWIVDPLDGTTNFVHGYPRVGVSLALIRGREPELGVILDVARQELYWATRGGGAWQDGRALQASAVERLEEALLATGITREEEQPLGLWSRLESACHGVRVDGCASLDFCAVAAGRLEAFWEADLKPWDVAAGLLMVREAGGLVTDLQGQPAHPWSGGFWASNGRLTSELLADHGL